MTSLPARIHRIESEVPDSLALSAESSPEPLSGLRPFGSADGIVARAAFRLVSVSTGLDPHCLGVPEVTFYRDPEAYSAAVAGFMAGTEEGVAAWILYCCKALEAGAREATSIADAAGD